MKEYYTVENFSHVEVRITYTRHKKFIITPTDHNTTSKREAALPNYSRLV